MGLYDYNVRTTAADPSDPPDPYADQDGGGNQEADAGGGSDSDPISGGTFTNDRAAPAPMAGAAAEEAAEEVRDMEDDVTPSSITQRATDRARRSLNLGTSGGGDGGSNSGGGSSSGGGSDDGARSAKVIELITGSTPSTPSSGGFGNFLPFPVPGGGGPGPAPPGGQGQSGSQEQSGGGLSAVLSKPRNLAIAGGLAAAGAVAFLASSDGTGA